MLIFIIAGEPSGDLLGGALMAALKERTGGAVRFAGIGGERMTAQGLTSLVPIEELAIVGIAEILPRVRALLRRIRETAEAVIALQPDAVVTIDSSGFNWRVARLCASAARRCPSSIMSRRWSGRGATTTRARWRAGTTIS